MIDSQVCYKIDSMSKLGITLINDKFEKHDKESEDPFVAYGHGIKAYFRMMLSITAVMFIITLLFVPVLIKYKNGGAYSTQGTFLSYYSLGNIGHSEA